MDKNTVIGFGLMGLVLVLFSWLGRPSKEQLEQQQRYNDSVALAVQQQAIQDSINAVAGNQSEMALNDSIAGEHAYDNDSIRREAQLAQAFGELSNASKGVEQKVTIENDSMMLTFSTKGGVPVASELKNYNDYNGEPIRLIRPDDASIEYHFVTATNRVVSTKDLYFTATKESNNRLRMTLKGNLGQELSFIYTLRDKYLVDIDVEHKGFETVLAPNNRILDASITMPIYRNEKSIKSEQRYSGFAYEHSSGDVEKLNANKSTNKEVSGSVRWIAYRDMFFSTIFYSPDGFASVTMDAELLGKTENDQMLKMLSSKFIIPLDFQKPQAAQMKIYLGPNDYSLLNKIDHELGAGTSFAKIVDMGDWFRFINVWLVIPLFNFLEKFFSNYGVIILLLTLIIKIGLSPFTYKSYISQAKMRVLRPQIEEINAKYPGEEKMMERQRKTMELYQRAGVNTMGGCLPMLLQMPFLVAMYQYFPTSINLRGESFLWAQDLSTYDDVIRFGFDVPFIGSHISLFCLLMTVTQLIYMKSTTANQPQAPGMGIMKVMPYMMSIMIFLFLNSNASGLSYYYFLSLLISIVQTQVFRLSISEEKLLAKLEANKKKPAKKKSKWMQRLEEMQKQQMELQKQQEKQQRRR